MSQKEYPLAGEGRALNKSNSCAKINVGLQIINKCTGDPNIVYPIKNG